MAQPYVTGPAYTFVKTPGMATPAYFGTTEGKPRISEHKEYEPVRNTIRGTRKPYDLSYQGKDCIVSGRYNRYVESVWRAMQALAGVAGDRGLDPDGGIGTLMLTQGYAHELWLKFKFGGLAPFAGMPLGYHFFGAVLIGPDDMDDNGTTERKIMVTYHCLGVYHANSGAFLCYDEDMTAVNGIPIT